MALAETQALLARLFTDAQVRRDFFSEPRETARRCGLTEQEAETFATLDRRQVEDFAKSLLGKRALDARKALPRTAKALGRDFDRLLSQAIDGPPSPERHRGDAAALAGLLASQEDTDRPWIGELVRYEMTILLAARPGAVLLLRRFAYPVDDIARQLVAGARVDVSPRKRIGLWLRAPGGRLRHWLF